MFTVLIYRDRERACLVQRFSSHASQEETIRLAEQSLLNEFTACKAFRVVDSAEQVLAEGYRPGS